MTRFFASLALMASACVGPTLDLEGTPDVVTPGEPVDDVVSQPEGTVEDPPVAGDYGGEIRGSGAIVVSPDGVVFVADGDNGDIQIRLADDSPMSVFKDVGDEPARMMMVGDSLFVTLRGEGAVARLTDDHGTLTLAEKMPVGAEPYDLEFIRSTNSLYVTLSQEGAVVAVDPDTLEERQRFEFGGEPRWLERHGDTLFVAFADQARVVSLDVTTGAATDLSLPVVERFTDYRCLPRDLQARLTGDMTVDFSNGLLLVPTLYLDTQLAELVENSGEPGTLPPCGEVEAATISQDERPPPYYAPPVPPADPAKVGRFNASVVVFDIATGTPRQPLAVSQSVLPTSWSDPGRTYRGFPGDLGLTRVGDTDFVLVPLPGTGKIVSLAYEGARTLEPQGKFDKRFRGVLSASAGVQQAVAVGDLMWAWSPVSRKLSIASNGMAWPDQDRNAAEISSMDVLPSDLSPAVQRGRFLFHTSEHTGMVAADSGASCSACHSEGRTDGVTWKFEDMPRQTPSLAGAVSTTAPFTWTGEVESVEEEIHRTSGERMGGSGLTDTEAQDVAAFVESVRSVKRPMPATTAVDAQVALGRELFVRADVGCVTCHAGPDGADEQVHAVLGFEVATATPILRGIGATAPYFHDGSAETLRDVLDRAADGSMGNTGMLSDEELDALEAYLKHW